MAKQYRWWGVTLGSWQQESLREESVGYWGWHWAYPQEEEESSDKEEKMICGCCDISAKK